MHDTLSHVWMKEKSLYLQCVLSTSSWMYPISSYSSVSCMPVYVFPSKLMLNKFFFVLDLNPQLLNLIINRVFFELPKKHSQKNRPTHVKLHFKFSFCHLSINIKAFNEQNKALLLTIRCFCSVTDHCRSAMQIYFQKTISKITNVFGFARFI